MGGNSARNGGGVGGKSAYSRPQRKPASPRQRPRERDNERRPTSTPPPPKPKPKPKPILTPTTPEVSQVTETVATEPVSTQEMKDAVEERKLKTKRRGRSLTIYTGPRGVEEEPLTLGKPSLLGR